MRISDWSSDVCSSDLQQRGPVPLGFTAKQLDDRAQPLVAQRLEDADIDDLVAQLASVEKIERGERLEQPFMAFGQQGDVKHPRAPRSEEHTSELQSLMRISYAVFCLKKKNNKSTT